MRMKRRATVAVVIAGAVLAGPAVIAGPAQAAVSSGTFRGVTYVKNVVGPDVGYPTAVAVGDVLGTGRSDLVVTTVDASNQGGGTTVAVYPQTASRTLGKPLTIKLPDEKHLSNRIVITDLYGDGHREILLSGPSHIESVSYSGGHLKAAQIPVPSNDFTVASVNGDKYQDLLVATNQVGQTQVWTGSASRKFTLWRTVSFPGVNQSNLVISGREIFAADFDRNGRTDIAVLTETGFAVRLQTGNGVFGAEKAYKVAPINKVGFQPATMAVGDVTGDGYPDVVEDILANQPWSGVEVFAGTRAGTFKAPVSYPGYDNPAGLALADLNGDKRTDVVVVHNGADRLGVLLQRSTGTLAAESLYPGFTPDWEAPAVGDLNGDGKPDVAVTAGGDGTAIFYGK
jgi:FG-GAP-like repeat